MVAALKRIKTSRQEHTNAESGNTMVMYIMLFPIFFGAFGIAVDTTLATYTSTSLQSNLDAATQSALSHATNPGSSENTSNRPMLTYDQVHQYVIDVYDQNRFNTGEQGFLKCQESITTAKTTPHPNARLISPPSKCNWTEGSFNYYDKNGQMRLSVSFVEASSTVFSHILGIHEFKYNIESDSRISYVKG